MSERVTVAEPTTDEHLLEEYEAERPGRRLTGLAGVLVGVVVQRVFPELIERYFQMRPDTWFTPSSAVQGLMVGLLTTLLFTLPPLLSIRKITLPGTEAFPDSRLFRHTAQRTPRVC